MKITKLEFQKKDPSRVSVYVDGKFAVGLDQNELISLALYKDQEITPEHLQKIIFRGEAGKLFNSALNALSLRPRSENEIRQLLYRKTHRSARKKNGEISKKSVDVAENKKLVDDVVTRLYEKKFLDDEAFARWFLDQRTTFKPKGKIALKFELAGKGIDRKIVDSVLSEVSKTSEKDMAEEVLRKKMARSTKLSDDPREVKQKLTQFLVSRGFSWDLAAETVGRVFGRGTTGRSHKYSDE